jgi:hypothetical protein
MFCIGGICKKNRGEPFSILSIFSPLDAAIRENVNLESCLERLRLARERQDVPSIGSEIFIASTIHPAQKGTSAME